MKKEYDHEEVRCDAMEDYGIASWMSRHPSIDELFIFIQDQLHVKMDRKFVDDFNKQKQTIQQGKTK